MRVSQNGLKVNVTKHLILLLLIGLAWGQKQYNIEHIVEQAGVHKKKFSDEIINGEVFQMYGDMKVPLGKMRNGKREGVWTDWFDNGTKKKQTTYLKGKEFGLKIGFDKEGRKEYEVDIADSLNFTSKSFYLDGSIMTENEVVNGERYNGTFYISKAARGSMQKKIFDSRKTINTYEKGVLIQVEWFEDSNLENKVVVKVDDCVNTYDCLSEEERRFKNKVEVETAIKDAITKTGAVIEIRNDEEEKVLLEFKMITNKSFDGNAKAAYNTALNEIDAPKKTILKAIRTFMMIGATEQWIIQNPDGIADDFDRLTPEIFEEIKNNNIIAEAFENTTEYYDLPTLNDLIKHRKIKFDNPIQNYVYKDLKDLIYDLVELISPIKNDISKEEVQKAIININNLFTYYNIILSLHNNGLVEEQRPLVFKCLSPN